MRLIERVREMPYRDGLATIFGWMSARLLVVDLDSFQEANEAELFLSDRERARHEKVQAELAAERAAIEESKG